MRNESNSLADVLTRAYRVRQTAFPPRVNFVYPRRTLPVRTTGVTFLLNCSHCRGCHLKGMLPLEAALGRPPGGSHLVSGASDLRGRVPHGERLAISENWPGRAP